MLSSKAPRQIDGGPACRTGRAGHRAERAVPAGAVIVLLSVALAQGEDDWVGKRVVPRNHDFVLQVDDEPVEASRKALAIYRVERADGPMLWLQAEGQRLRGSARAEDVIPVERAVAFFNEQVRAHPQDPFVYSMRATIQNDKHAFDAALHDYDHALRLAPGKAPLYFGARR